ncbi:MAG: hypothetical protein K6V97_06620 [Actinomycetia bacterium]|nr:hypothetical protein [Actinomycetes bacterium]
MSPPVGWALAAATAVILAARRWAAWESALLALAGAVTGEPLVAWSGLIAGVGLARLAAARHRLRRLDRRDATVERFLERLRFVASTGLPLGPSLELAAASARRRPPRLQSAADVARWVETASPHPVLRRARPVWSVLDRHGGPVADVAAALLAEVRLERQLRWEREHGLSGPLGTLTALAWTPPVVLGMFRWVMPPFYADLTHTVPGQLGLAAVATLTTGVLVLAAAWALPREELPFARDIP